MTTFLVAYASKHGSTQQVAEAIAKRLAEQGDAVDLRPAAAVRGRVGADVVVLGGALYSGRWHRDAHRFLKRHREELALVPVAVFGMGPRSGEAEGWDRSRHQLDRALAKHQQLRPAAVAVFGGVDPEPHRGEPPRDLRDWTAIQAWADSVRDLTPQAR